MRKSPKPRLLETAKAEEMSSSFEPRLDILPESLRDLWPELDAVPSDFVLYGGTALALQLGHRVSEDFDFFSSEGFDPNRVKSRLPFLRDLDPAAGEDVGSITNETNSKGMSSAGAGR